MIFLFCYFSLVNGQEVSNKNQWSIEAKKDLDSMKKLFDSNIEQLELKEKDYKIGYSDKTIDLNSTREEIIKIQNVLANICTTKKSYKEILKGKVKTDSLNKWFNDEKCDKLIFNKDLNNETHGLEDKFLMTNAINFDFSGTSKTNPGYFGHINYFFNTIKASGKPSKLYINTGLMKVNYYSQETNHSSFKRYDNIKLSPLDTSNQYIKSFNKYDYNIKLSSYSAYIQLLQTFGKSKNIFSHLHGEIMVTNFQADLTITALEKDTLIKPTSEIIPINDYLDEKQNFNEQNISGYFGAGLTAKYKLLNNKISYFIQGTVGFSKTQLNPKLVSLKNNPTTSFEKANDWDKFFIVHSYFDNDISGVHVILGSQIRGNFKNPPFYTFYVGINLSLDNLGAIFK